MLERNILDFRSQAEQMMEIIDSRITTGNRQAAIELLILKFKTLYEQGVSSGRLYEKEGVYPYTPIDK